MSEIRDAAGGGVKPLASVLKAFELLDFLATSRTPMRLAEIARGIGGNRATVYQRLLTLSQAGWVEASEQGFYRLTLRATWVGEAALQQASLGDRAQAILQALAIETGETTSLAMIAGNQIRIVRRVEPPGVLKAELHVGGVLKLDSSASGRVLATFMPQTSLIALTSGGEVMPPDAMCEAVRRQGYALSSGRDMPEVMAIAVPVFDDEACCYATLSLMAPLSRFKQEALLPPLIEAAEQMRSLRGSRAQRR